MKANKNITNFAMLMSFSLSMIKPIVNKIIIAQQGESHR